ncbi:ankyrin repeat-containing domain protein [Lactarius deliciosus]|nr:ankyrin repeat-containing domain protein [Lactarius deliciosus]
MTDIIVKIMVEVISILGVVTKEVRQGRTKKYLKKLAGRNDVEDALQRLDRLTQEEARMAAVETLMITRGIGDKVDGVNERVQIVNTKVEGIDNKVGSVTQDVKENRVAIQQVVNHVSDLNRNELRQNLRKWIAPPDPSVNYNTASDAHHKGTAAWCTKGNTLANWRTSGSLLWIHGKPGSGKSILSSVIIRDIKPMSTSGSAFLAYFYFDFKDKVKQDSRALLSSLLVQLSDQSDMFLPIYLILDALDECPYESGLPSPREKLLELLDELVKLRQPILRLCVTSRPEFDICIALEPLATQQVSLHKERGQLQDINNYVTDVVRSDRRMRRWRDEEKDMVIEKLTEKADGMFRWVYCQLEVLRYCFPTDVRRVLMELPKSLDETYKRILEGISNSNREHSYRLLQCLTVASRPLRVQELAELLAIDFKAEGIPKLNADWRWEDQEEAVLSTCSSLVTVIVDRGLRVVQFSHFSVKEFLTSDRLAGCTEEVSRFHIPIEPSHVVLAQACLGALLCLDDDTGDEYDGDDEYEYEDEDDVNNVSFVRYAAKYWVGHAKVGNAEMHLKDSMAYLFDMDKPYFRAWVRMHDVDEPWRNITLTSASPLYFAAACGFHGLVKRLIDNHPQHVSAQAGHYGTPLHATLLNGHIEVAQLLRERGADVNALNMLKKTPLDIVSRRGRLAAAKWLLDCGVDVNPQDQYRLTPLHSAAINGHLEVVRILLEHNADINARSVHGYTSLIFASESGYPDVVRYLLDHNADAYARDITGKTALGVAAQFGHHEVCQILLERNVEVNPRDDEGSIPLHRASEGFVGYSDTGPGGYPDVVQLLLDHGADAQSRNLSGKTASEVARGPEKQEIIRLFSQHTARRTNETG